VLQRRDRRFHRGDRSSDRRIGDRLGALYLGAQRLFDVFGGRDM